MKPEKRNVFTIHIKHVLKMQLTFSIQISQEVAYWGTLRWTGVPTWKFRLRMAYQQVYINQTLHTRCRSKNYSSHLPKYHSIPYHNVVLCRSSTDSWWGILLQLLEIGQKTSSSSSGHYRESVEWRKMARMIWTMFQNMENQLRGLGEIVHSGED